MRRLAIWGLAACLFGACTLTPQAETEEVAAVICKCSQADIPSVQQQCIDKLVPQLGTVSQSCYDCVYANQTTCTTLIMQCTSACSMMTPTGGN